VSAVSRGIARLGGTWGKKQVWCLHVRTWRLSGADVLYWRKCLWRYCDFWAPPAVIRRPHYDSAPGELCLPFQSSLRPSLRAFEESTWIASFHVCYDSDLHISTFQQWVSTQLVQSNQLTNYFTRKSIWYIEIDSVWTGLKMCQLREIDFLEQDKETENMFPCVRRDSLRLTDHNVAWSCFGEASSMASRAITSGELYPAESCDYVCFAPLRHYRNIPSRFSFFTALFSWLTIRTCSMITAVQFAMHWWW